MLEITGKYGKSRENVRKYGISGEKVVNYEKIQ